MCVCVGGAFISTQLPASSENSFQTTNPRAGGLALRNGGAGEEDLDSTGTCSQLCHSLHLVCKHSLASLLCAQSPASSEHVYLTNARKCLLSTNLCSICLTNANSVNPHHNPMRQVLSLSSLYRKLRHSEVK